MVLISAFNKMPESRSRKISKLVVLCMAAAIYCKALLENNKSNPLYIQLYKIPVIRNEHK